MENELNRGSVIVVPHFDDEIYCAGSILVTYKHNITIVITHPTDTCSADRYLKQLKMFHECIESLNCYRSNHNMKPINVEVIEGATPNGLPSNLYISAISRIENAIKTYDIVDYYIYTIRSGHQSHTECNQIAMAVMRHDYLAKMKCVLMSPYPMTYFTPGYFDDADKCYNTFIKLNKVEAESLYKIIDEVYAEKSPKNSVLGGEAFFDALKFFGRASNAEYAQPFVCKRLIL